MATHFHEGELAVQQRAGVRAEAARLDRMLEPLEEGGLGVGAGLFLSQQRFAALTARDGAGRLWTSPLIGPAGFLVATDLLTVLVPPPPGDPLHGVPAGQDVGLVVLDPARRRRLRVNGRLTRSGSALAIEVEQAYGNCPQHIHPYRLEPSPAAAGPTGGARTSLDPDDVDQLAAADTFFLGTTHPTRGVDSSHRGGPPGFVEVDGDVVRWPDFAGNNMFNSLGNLAVDPSAALLVPDFATGRSLHLSGTAVLEERPDGTRRGVALTVEAVRVGPPLGLRAT